MLNLLSLFISFCQIGFTSFGGFSMVPLINSEMIGHGWMTSAEVADIVAIAEMTPGPFGLNCATFAGMRVAGVLGALMANLGIMAPTFTVTAVAAVFFNKCKDSDLMKRMLVGVRPACIGMILGIMLTLSLENYFPGGVLRLTSVLIGGIATYLLVVRKWSIPLVIVIGAVLGLIFC